MAPTPRPAKLRLIEGARPDKVNRAEPIAPDELLVAPDVIDDGVRAVWDYTVRQLDHMRITSSADRDALYAYCVAVVVNRDAAETLRSRGLVVTGLHGGPTKNPAWQIWRDSANAIRAFAAEFGLTPSGRTRIQVKDGADDSDNPFAASQ